MNKLKDLVQNYRSQHLAFPAFNIDSYEIFQALVRAVKDTGLPCIAQLSPGEDQYFGAENLFLLVKKCQLDGLPIYLNMDHGNNITRLKQLIKLGYDMIHFDGSKIDYSTNLMLAKDLVDFAHYYHALVEVEFDQIKSTETNVDSPDFTNPSVAKTFITTTKADFFAVSIGNKHGALESQPEYINLPLLAEIASVLPDTYLTLHGGSGIDSHQISTAILGGIVKININTDLRHVFKTSLAQSISLPTDKVYELLAPVIEELSQVIKQKLVFFVGK